MAYSKSSAANLALRALLTAVGERRDAAVLGLAPGELRDKKLKNRLRDEFESKCVYCGVDVGGDGAKAVVDHLVPMNKTSLGLHQLGNIVLACSECNQAKGGLELKAFLAVRPDFDAVAIAKKLSKRQTDLGAIHNTAALSDLATNLAEQIIDLLDQKMNEAAELLGQVKPQNVKAKVEIQRKVDHDFSKVAARFPVGCFIRTNDDHLVGEVVDYTLQGRKGKRTECVTFIEEKTGKPVRRSPNTMVQINRRGQYL